MWQIKTPKGNLFYIQKEKGKWLINGETLDWDLQKTDNHKFHALLKNKGYDIEFVSLDAETKQLKLKINNKLVELEAKDDIDLLLERTGIGKSQGKKTSELKAPMPGMVLEISVKEGDVVKKGEKLLILEAMKMENVLKSPADVKIKSIAVVKGKSVEKGQLLMSFE
jgi:biotin carboxyl carrier protein